MPNAADQPSPTSSSGTAALSTTDLTGQKVGDFQILRKLGAGGMGHVYLARQLSLKREVALKFLRADLTTNATALKRFQAEAEAVARLNHPNIVQVFAVGEHAGMRYMALEFVDGRNLREYLARKGPPDLPVCLSVMRQVAAALQKAHEQGIVHRDIKPENILITRKVGVKVADFGLSRVFNADGVHLTQSGVTLGTPLYISPEQAQGHTVDHRSDIYSFGVTCFHLLAGEPPFRGTTAVEVALKHITDPPPTLSDLRPDLPADLCALVMKMLAKKPDDRYQTARDVLRDLVKVREGLVIGVSQMAGLNLSVPGAGVPASPSAAGLSGQLGSSVPLTTATEIPAVPRIRWGRWLLAGLACLIATGVGIGGYLLLHPAAEPTPAPPVPPATVGLPDVRPPERLTTARERELLALINTRGTKPDDVIVASVELGLLYVRESTHAPPGVREKLLDEARIRFETLEKEQQFGPISSYTAQQVGKLGRAVVLAHLDKPTDSNTLFLEVINRQVPKIAPKKEPALVFQNFLSRYPDLSQAVAEALTRNQANLAPAKLPGGLDLLRTPRGMPK